MAFAFDATFGGAAANSYIPVQAATDYLGGRFGASAWQTLVDQEKALAMATARLEQERYVGFLKTQTQRLRWPRTWVPRGEGVVRDPGSGAVVAGFPSQWYADTEMPPPLIAAVSELALWVLTEGVEVDAFAESGLMDFQSLSLAGAGSFTPDNSGGTVHRMPPHVERFLRGLRASSEPLRLVRG